MAFIWIKTTNDEYEFIVAMGDTAEKLARECKTSVNTIYSAMSHAKKKGSRSIYKKVVLED
jgi:DNA-binding CsgD family transcriptional regulator